MHSSISPINQYDLFVPNNKMINFTISGSKRGRREEKDKRARGSNFRRSLALPGLPTVQATCDPLSSYYLATASSCSFLCWLLSAWLLPDLAIKMATFDGGDATFKFGPCHYNGKLWWWWSNISVWIFGLLKSMTVGLLCFVLLFSFFKIAYLGGKEEKRKRTLQPVCNDCHRWTRW